MTDIDRRISQVMIRRAIKNSLEEEKREKRIEKWQRWSLEIAAFYIAAITIKKFF